MYFNVERILRYARTYSSILEPSSGFEPETPSLPWKCSTPELRWRQWCRERDSNPRRRKPSDLQSDLVDRLSIPAELKFIIGATCRIRTDDPRFTKPML